MKKLIEFLLVNANCSTMKRLALFISVLFFSKGFLIFSQPNNCDICNSALKQDVMSYSFTETLYYHFLNIVDQSMYESIKRDGGVNFPIPMADDIIMLSANYNDFEQRRSNLFVLKNFNYHRNQSLQIVQTSIKDKGYDSFDNCIKLCMGNGAEPLYSYIINSDKDIVTLVVEYKPGVYVTAPIRITSSYLTYGTYRNKSYLFSDTTTIQPNSRMSFDIKRGDNKKVRGEIQGRLSGMTKSTNFLANEYYIPKVDTITETIVLNENENCNIGGCKNFRNILKIEHLECTYFSPSGSLSVHLSTIDQYRDNITFGQWTNAQCGTNGSGWSGGPWDTCKTGVGTGRCKITELTAKITYLKKQ